MLKLDNIHTFYGESHILHGISLEVREGDVVCLLGRNGAGKSTTLKSIMGICPSRSGSILFNGHDIARLKPYKIAKLGIGYVPEDRRIFSNLSVVDNLEMGIKAKGMGKWTIARVWEVFPELKRLQKSKGMALSGGEQQMLTVARTLMGDPELLILDEPSEGLAPVIVKKLGRLLKQLKEGMTILLAEQNANFAIALSDRGYAIEKGKISFHGTKEEIQSDEELKSRYLAV
jgi:branched-chain amino acid transport system ATP-binding protein